MQSFMTIKCCDVRIKEPFKDIILACVEQAKISTGFASIYRENIEFTRESELHIFLTLNK